MPSGCPVGLDRPLHRRRDQRLLHCVLALVEAPVTAHEHAEDVGVEAPDVGPLVQPAVGRHISRLASCINGRISTPT